MSHSNTIPNLKAIFLALIAISLVACGGGSSSTGGNGSVGLMLTDGPTADFAEVNVTITEISLIPDDDHGNNGQVVLFSGEEKVDLLRLTDFSQLFALSSNVPAGEYEKIRLQLKQPNGIELVKKDAMGNVTETIYPGMLANGKIDLNPRGDFHVMAGQTLYIQLDIDANKSLHITQTGNGQYKFRPVIFVEVLTDQNSGKLVRHFGYVRKLDPTKNRFKLCATPMATAMPAPGTTDDGMDSTARHHYEATEDCIKVVAANTSFFGEDGSPVDINSVQNDAMLTAIGYVRSYDDDDDEEEETETDSSDSSSDSSTHVNEAENDSETDEDEYEDEHHVRLYAEVVELGAVDTFAIVDGTVATEPQTNADAFGLTLADTSEISVQLQSGTKVFARDGQRLDYQGIDMGLTASVDGVYSTLDSSVLNSSLVIVDTNNVDAMEQVSGTVLSVDPVGGIITLSTSTGEVMVRVSSTTMFKLQDGSTQTDVDILAVTDTAHVDAYGHTSTIDGIFDADTVIIEAAVATP